MRIRGQSVHVGLFFQKMDKENKTPTFLRYHKFCDTMQMGHTFRLTQREFDNVLKNRKKRVII